LRIIGLLLIISGCPKIEKNASKTQAPFLGMDVFFVKLAYFNDLFIRFIFILKQDLIYMLEVPNAEF